MDFASKRGQQKAFFQEKVAYPETQIFYESPHREGNLREYVGCLWITRELTNIYEEYTAAVFLSYRIS